MRNEDLIDDVLSLQNMLVAIAEFSHVEKESDFLRLREIATTEPRKEALALLRILALGNHDVQAGRVKPLADVVARLRAKRPGGVTIRLLRS